MSPRHYRIGDPVTLRDVKDRKASFTGRVVAFRDLSGPRQKLWVRRDDDGPGDNRNGISFVVVDLGGPDFDDRVDGEPRGRLCGPPIDLPSADELARLILERRDIRMPIEIQLNTLATAILQAERPRRRKGGKTT